MLFLASTFPYRLVVMLDLQVLGQMSSRSCRNEGRQLLCHACSPVVYPICQACIHQHSPDHHALPMYLQCHIVLASKLPLSGIMEWLPSYTENTNRGTSEQEKLHLHLCHLLINGSPELRPAVHWWISSGKALVRHKSTSTSISPSATRPGLEMVIVLRRLYCASIDILPIENVSATHSNSM